MPPASVLAALLAGMVVVGPGVRAKRDSLAQASRDVLVPPFQLDRTPVTNRAFLAFVNAAQEWRRDRAPRLLADERYLSRWESPTSLGAEAEPDAPVVFVSWFAARAYCAARGARLPTADEWELASQASEVSPRGDLDPAWRQRILAWYATPSPTHLPQVRRGRPNYWGVYDLHGLVWEWVLDFNSELVASDARGDGASRFCGGGALEGNAGDYAEFMRSAFRASLHAPYTVASLGFRCAADAHGRSP